MLVSLRNKLLIAGTIIATATMSMSLSALAQTAESYWQYGMQCMMSHEYNKAIKYFDVVIRMKPTYAMAYLARGKAYENLKNLDAAYADFSKAIQVDPKRADAMVARADILRRRGDPQAALLDANRAIKLLPNIPVAHVFPAWCYADMEDWTKAKAELDKVGGEKGISDAPKRAKAEFLIINARILNGGKHYKEAIAACDRALQIGPPTFCQLLALAQKAYAHEALKDDKAAIADITKALQLKPDKADASIEKDAHGWSVIAADLYLQRGRLQHKLGDDWEATTDYKAAIQMCEKEAPQDVVIDRAYSHPELRIAQAQYLLGNYDECIKHLNSLVTIAETDKRRLGMKPGIVYSLRGNANQRAGHAEEAKADLARANELHYASNAQWDALIAAPIVAPDAAPAAAPVASPAAAPVASPAASPATGASAEH